MTGNIPSCLPRIIALLCCAPVLLPSLYCRADEAPSLQILQRSSGGLGDELDVQVTNWPAVKPDLKANPKNDPKNWILYFNGVPVNGVYPENTDFRDGQFRFYLHGDNSNDKSKQTWDTLHRGFAFYKPVTVGIGPESGELENVTPQKDFQLVVVPVCPFITFCIGMALLLVGFIILAYKSDLLRDGDTSPATGRRPYSLGRTQMAIWFFLILAAYLYIGMVNWNYLNTIPASALGLMGISAATALGAVLIDQDKATQSTSLKAEQAALQARVNTLPSLIAAAAPADQPALTAELTTKRARLDAVNQQVATLPAPNYGSENFVRDLLTDANGISLHRFQIFVWTLALGAVFVTFVVRDLAMPEFGATLLALMGISSGTYLGFKFPEKKN